ncbi:putative membrane protein, partial [Chlamydia psittaci 09DC78]
MGFCLFFLSVNLVCSVVCLFNFVV